ncbi:DUF3006 family protein [Bacillus lacus]|uniref:DUF3006 family protein n=1 Tax=Metabacillus lacus TaxID=1983721 RepID=A0A7X2IXH5_9BACI|nr:DUF3006 domain-containing protein [Metabacillus lacus]MRX71626.1 DUF3006 family protein [Metabacillus lacus]
MDKERKLFIVDRLEGDYAVIEFGRETFPFPKEKLPPEMKEGDVLDIAITINAAATQERKQHIEALTNSLFRDE